MSSNVILSCPFCHQKAEYRDAPPNSTVRCQDCSSVFRVPANALAKHKPGTVLKGEQTHRRGGYVKPLLIVFLLAAIAGAGYYLWVKVIRPPAVVGDVDAHDAKWGIDTHTGVMERFMLRWKAADLDGMLKYCLLENREAMKTEKEKEWRDSIFDKYKLASFVIKGYTLIESTGALEYVVDVDGMDSGTKSPWKGIVKARVLQQEEPTPDGGKRRFWAVDIRSAAPMVE